MPNNLFGGGRRKIIPTVVWEPLVISFEFLFLFFFSSLVIQNNINHNNWTSRADFCCGRVKFVKYFDHKKVYYKVCKNIQKSNQCSISGRFLCHQRRYYAVNADSLGNQLTNHRGKAKTALASVVKQIAVAVRG